MDNNSSLIFLLQEYLKRRLRLTEYILKAFSIIRSLSPLVDKRNQNLSEYLPEVFPMWALKCRILPVTEPLKQCSSRRLSCCPYPHSDILYLYRGAEKPIGLRLSENQKWPRPNLSPFPHKLCGWMKDGVAGVKWFHLGRYRTWQMGSWSATD